MASIMRFDIEIHDTAEPSQARYLVHGHDDVLWTDDLDAAIASLKSDVERFEKKDQDMANKALNDKFDLHSKIFFSPPPYWP